VLGVPRPLKVGGLRPPTLPGTSGIVLRKIFSIFDLFFGAVIGDFGSAERADSTNSPGIVWSHSAQNSSNEFQIMFL